MPSLSANSKLVPIPHFVLKSLPVFLFSSWHVPQSEIVKLDSLILVNYQQQILLPPADVKTGRLPSLLNIPNIPNLEITLF